MAHIWHNVAMRLVSKHTRSNGSGGSLVFPVVGLVLGLASRPLRILVVGHGVCR